MAKRHDDEMPEVAFAEGDDSVTRETDVEHPDAERVRTGELSAAQLPGGSGNVDPEEPDAQYPPGVVQNSATTVFRNTAATPDYGTNADE